MPNNLAAEDEPVSTYIIEVLRWVQRMRIENKLSLMRGIDKAERADTIECAFRSWKQNEEDINRMFIMAKRAIPDVQEGYWDTTVGV